MLASEPSGPAFDRSRCVSKWGMRAKGKAIHRASGNQQWVKPGPASQIVVWRCCRRDPSYGRGSRETKEQCVKMANKPVASKIEGPRPPPRRAVLQQSGAVASPVTIASAVAPRLVNAPRKSPWIRVEPASDQLYRVARCLAKSVLTAPSLLPGWLLPRPPPARG